MMVLSIYMTLNLLLILVIFYRATKDKDYFQEYMGKIRYIIELQGKEAVYGTIMFFGLFATLPLYIYLQFSSNDK